MIGFLEMTPDELATLPDTVLPLTAIELRSILLALDGDTFEADSIYGVGLRSADDKLEKMMIEVRLKIGRSRRGLTDDAAAE
ncbi:hypothetical protein F3J45_28520 [Pantoea sp. Ap-967]|uniref:hypothetical protein n=1 Tax=Pantoea sp. Ap-967 TaxID=2608362 RepID=UPI00141E7950|nr:hypothetical protein [Pantoea sp. Ap-967]NIE78376.1 hypothetical protein [Pantoea sp. Ap-967]